MTRQLALSSKPNERLQPIVAADDGPIGIYLVSKSNNNMLTRRMFLKITLVSAAAALAACKGLNIPTQNNTGISVTYSVTVPINVFGGGVSMRVSPSPSASEIVLLPPGMPLLLIGRTEDSQWVEVQLSNGVTGWLATNFVNLETGVEIGNLSISSRKAAVIATKSSSNGNPNELVEDVSQEVIEELAQEAIDDAIKKGQVKSKPIVIPTVAAKPSLIPTTGGDTGGDTLVQPCVPGPPPPGYICTCNCI